ncbi:MAG TPA: BamA/TamA family outer membrane protein [Woeseiaceae bacterium]|nr:BamA/TamA family outer membrane protein [Woeseiaceae bacterium]
MPDAFLQFVPSRAAGRPRFGGFFLLLLLLGGGGAAWGDELEYSITGIDEKLLSNVLAHVESFSLTGTGRVMPGQFEEAIEEAKQRARAALKPYGYYHPNITTDLVRLGPESWRLRMRIEPGPPVRVATAEIDVRGPGSRLGLLQEWEASFPLTPGAVLDQQSWQREKEAALQAANAHGYLSAEFVKEAIRIDLVKNEAYLELVLETGEQAHFGNIVFEQDVVNPGIVAEIPRFKPGMPYRQDLVNKLRVDLWQTGYFTDIEVVERKNLDRSPPTVDIIAKAFSETRDTYQGTIGFGTDTGARAQLFWSRHPLSAAGDRIDVGIGYQAIDDEFSLRTDYRIPRRGEGRQFWVASLKLQRDKQDLEVKREQDDENFVTLAPGSVDDLFLRFGKLQVRNRELGQDQVFETWFVQYLRESYDYDPGPDADADIRALLADRRTSTLFRDTIGTLAVGVEWDWPSIRGSGFSTDGHHERAWIFTSNEVWGSDREFTQIYASSRRSWLRGERWKYLLRAEVGITDAHVDELTLDVGGEPFELSITELPDHYRFKAGGGSSVRGYGFEDLSNNDIGSNNIIAASAEIEMRVLPKWSVAAFFDIGNAFNDWSEFELRKGAGVGIRWYSVAGALRLDFARALDVEGTPWAVHFSIGTPLL